MPYDAHFTSKFDQSGIIDFAISQAHSESGIEDARGGVCQLISLMWLGKSAWTDVGFKDLIKNAVSSSQGAAYWKQVCASYAFFTKRTWGESDRAERLTTMYQLVSKDKAHTLTLDKRTDDADELGNYLGTKANYTCYFRLELAAGGHGCALKRWDSSSYVFFDPNMGNAVDLIGLSAGLPALIRDCKTNYDVQFFETYVLA